MYANLFAAANLRSFQLISFRQFFQALKANVYQLSAPSAVDPNGHGIADRWQFAPR